jgi:uncharacterized protein YyaL (SSP411 family)
MAAVEDREPMPEGAPLGREAIDAALEQLRSSFDPERGGFGEAPKFPPHQALELLLDEQDRGAPVDDLTLITTTLDAMARGGIHDHLGGGFHRYATDAQWFLPHFEKMLYDNAQLLPIYAEASRLTGDPVFAETAHGIAGWMLREMRDEAGGFHSALDADSEGVEGLFYVWSEAELLEILGEEDGGLFARVFGVEARGNYFEEARRVRTGRNVLYLARPLREQVLAEGMEPEAFIAKIDAAKARLLAVRVERVWPHRDDKVLAAWNGLAIGGLARAGKVLGEPGWIEAAGEAADFVLARMRGADGRLLRSWRAGEARLGGYLDDYAFCAWGLLELHAATGDDARLAAARELADRMLADFWDEAAHGFHFTADGHERLLVRLKDPYDKALPAGNGVAALVLQRLAALTGEPSYAVRADECLDAFAPAMARAPRATLSLLRAQAERVGAGRGGGELPPPARETGGPAEAAARTGPVAAEAYLSRLRVSPGEELRVAVRLVVDEGWHATAHRPGDPRLVGTDLALAGDDPALELEGVEYPVGVERALGVADAPLSVYAGEAWIEAFVAMRGDAPPGPRTLALELGVQACDDSRCLAPALLPLAVEVEVAPGASDEPGLHAPLFP